jgi:hypothetical protein
MCFQLYAGTIKPIPRRKWDQASPDISVVDLNEDEIAVKAYFSMPEAQYIGSTSHCGCDFPHLMFQNGGWASPWEEKDPEQVASDRQNQEALVTALRQTAEVAVELYGVWSGDFSEPKSREEILITDLLNPNCYFKEQGFYRVRL